LKTNNLIINWELALSASPAISEYESVMLQPCPRIDYQKSFKNCIMCERTNIFIDMLLISVISISLGIILRRRAMQSKTTLKKLEIESSIKKHGALGRVGNNNQ
jgi:hypothetical protein